MVIIIQYKPQKKRQLQKKTNYCELRTAVALLLLICLYNVCFRVTSIADKLNVDFALIHKERKKANEVGALHDPLNTYCQPFFICLETQLLYLGFIDFWYRRLARDFGWF